jgi:hypothetical protein
MQGDFFREFVEDVEVLGLVGTNVTEAFITTDEINFAFGWRIHRNGFDRIGAHPG